MINDKSEIDAENLIFSLTLVILLQDKRWTTGASGTVWGKIRSFGEFNGREDSTSG